MLDTPVLLGRTSVNIFCVVCKVSVLDLLRTRCRWESVLDATGNDVALEQNVDGLERHTLGLGNAEDGVEAHDDAARSE